MKNQELDFLKKIIQHMAYNLKTNQTYYLYIPDWYLQQRDEKSRIGLLKKNHSM